MQPYFFPYIGYFQLINAVDEWVIFDDIQYIRHGWVNRNRILSPNLEKEWQHILVPLDKHHQEDFIHEIKIIDTNNWKDDAMGKLSYYKRIRAPYYDQIIVLIEKCFDNNPISLVELNTLILKHITDYLSINFNYSISSQKSFNFSNVVGPGDWALEISKQMKASVYINPIGGKEIFDKDKYFSEGIELQFLKSREIKYKQSRRSYVPWLSIIDIMMFNSIENIKLMLDEYELE